MKTLKLFCLGSWFLALGSFAQTKLWYETPANDWMKALPLGNGRLGAMVFGGVETETVALNEITMWSGQPDPNQEKRLGKAKLQEIRQLFYDGKFAEGNNLTSNLMAGIPNSFGTHLPVGDLKLNFQYSTLETKNYYRDLNIENAISSVSFQKGDVKFSREYFCSNPDNILVIKLSSDKRAALNFSLSLDLMREAQIAAKENALEFRGDMQNLKSGGVAFFGNITVKTDDGKVLSEHRSLRVENATNAYIFIDIQTNFVQKDYKNICQNTIKNAFNTDYSALKQRHITDYARLFSRVELFLGKSETDNLPTDIRWQRIKDGGNDVALDALFFQYARYLLLASSRENSPLPANLQGIWNDNLANNMGWTCDYHMDINTQQNYWLANVGNLAECNAPLFRYLEDLAVFGQKTAKNVYDARGWTTNTMTNVWGFTASGWGVNWGLFPMAGPWIATHLWTHFVYTQDKNFLAQQAYPLLRESAKFVLDYLTEDPKTGYLITGPATSPENAFSYNGDVLSISLMTTTDRVLAVEIFNEVIAAAQILNVDKTFSDTLKNALAKLPPLKISQKYGGVQEWYEDFDEAYPNHRHTCHLIALYPFNQINVEKTPKLAVAAKQTLRRRLAAPDWEDVEWSRANMICFDARLKNAEEAYQSVVGLEQTFTRENLLTISPEGIAGAPYDIFIFDGNEAGAAGIAEMLLQSQNDYIEFLPALPAEWKTGYFKGLCVQGGGVVDLFWENSKTMKAALTATADNIFKIKFGKNLPKCSKNGKTFKPKTTRNGIAIFDLKKNDVLELTKGHF